MINVNELNACFARKKLSKTDAARICGVSPKTFYNWIEKRAMPTDKAEMLISALEIHNPTLIFFDGKLPRE